MGMLKNVRVNWVSLLQPKENLQGELEYSTQIIISKDNKEALDALNTMFKMTLDKATQDFGAKETKGIKLDKLKDGDLAKDADGNPIECLKNSYYMSVKNKKAPQVIKAYKKEGKIIRLPAEPNDIYSGCYGMVDLNPYFYNAKLNKGITFYINSFIKTRDGENLGGSKTDVYSIDIDDAALEEMEDFADSLEDKDGWSSI
jgi:hypothetical protein